MTNNTVADNRGSASGGGLLVTGSVAPYISNNILWGNDAPDLSITHTATWLTSNDIGSQSGNADPGSSGNLSVDPEFATGFGYHLSFVSPLRNQGAADVAGGLPAFDLDGWARVQGGQVDIGAYEIRLIFISGFEDGLFSGWSEVVGAVGAGR